ncbi:unnamed protein product [Fraxinus pennsylvanica]|uniref:Protein kinase domain-containing protein n=1 Tax=Fraxinus pennsylvanica TaxID=56036 RepID=A0AAD1YU11_9LAMI|nr:unnamed protein product [Fraxinus pennsylvanica]
MEKLEYIEYFNVSFNELTGEIPNGGPFKNFTSYFFIGNGELCGASKFKVKSCKGDTTRLSSNTKFLKYILPSIAVVLSLAITVVYLIKTHSRNTLLPATSTSPVTIKRISYYEVLNVTNKFGEERLIGRGSIGLVYKGIFSDGMIAAIKVFNVDLQGTNQSFDIECKILCNIRHRTLVKMKIWLPDFGIAKLFTEDQRISITKTLGTIGYMAPEYGSTGLVSTMVDVYSYGIMLMETFAKKKPTDDMFVGKFTMRKWVLESFPNEIMHIVDVDLVNAVEDNIRVKERCFKLIMEVALECTTDLPEERLNAKDVLTSLKKIKT